MTSRIFEDISKQVREGLAHDQEISKAAKDRISSFASDIIEIDIERGLKYADKIRDWATTNVTLSSNDAYHQLVHLTEQIDESLFSISKKIRNLNQ